MSVCYECGMDSPDHYERCSFGSVTISKNELANMQAKIKELDTKNEKLCQQVCDECSPDDYGWKYNRVDGKHPCTCIVESGAYQELKSKLKEAEGLLRKFCSSLSVEVIQDTREKSQQFLNQPEIK